MNSRVDASRELYLFLVLHGKPSMRETVTRLLAGASVTELGRESSVYAGDARVVENVLAGRLVHVAPTWQRRTSRVAELVIRHRDDLSPALVANAHAVLDDAELLGSGGRRSRDELLADLL